VPDLGGGSRKLAAAAAPGLHVTNPPPRPAPRRVRFVTVSVTVGPASGVLKDKPQAEWTPKEVALTVLIDRCGPRLEAGPA
jgi:hypothetical protein